MLGFGERIMESRQIVLYIINLIIGGIIIDYGVSYEDDCHNGVTDFLVFGGIVTICANLIAAVFHFV